MPELTYNTRIHDLSLGSMHMLTCWWAVVLQLGSYSSLMHQMLLMVWMAMYSQRLQAARASNILLGRRAHQFSAGQSKHAPDGSGTELMLLPCQTNKQTKPDESQRERLCSGGSGTSGVLLCSAGLAYLANGIDMQGAPFVKASFISETARNIMASLDQLRTQGLLSSQGLSSSIESMPKLGKFFDSLVEETMAGLSDTSTRSVTSSELLAAGQCARISADLRFVADWLDAPAPRQAPGGQSRTGTGTAHVYPQVYGTDCSLSGPASSWQMTPGFEWPVDWNRKLQAFLLQRSSKEGRQESPGMRGPSHGRGGFHWTAAASLLPLWPPESNVDMESEDYARG